MSALEKATGLNLPAFSKHDVLAAPQAVVPEALAPQATAQGRLIRAFSDVVR